MSKAGSFGSDIIYRADTAMRRQLVASLRLQQKTPAQMVDELARVGCVNPKTGEPWSESVIREDLKTIVHEWRLASRVAVQEHVATMLASLREVQRVAWERNDLESVLKALDKEMKLLGLTAPQTISITTNDRAKELASILGVEKEELLRVARSLAAGEAP